MQLNGFDLTPFSRASKEKPNRRLSNPQSSTAEVQLHYSERRVANAPKQIFDGRGTRNGQAEYAVTLQRATPELRELRVNALGVSYS